LTPIGAQLEGIVPNHADSLATGTAALVAQRRFLTTFMQRYADRD
jgi:hypothetical protein